MSVYVCEHTLILILQKLAANKALESPETL